MPSLILNLALRSATVGIIILLVVRFYQWKGPCPTTFGIKPLECVGWVSGFSIFLVLLQTIAEYGISNIPGRFAAQYGMLICFFVVGMLLG
jgi:hypothetical protein